MNRRLKRFLSEPFLHFLLIGLAIFISSSYIARKREIHKIVIDKSVIAKLTMAWQSQFGRAPNSSELKMAMDDYVKQEVLVREAQQLGLNQDDEIIKRRLQQKMAFIIKDNIILPDPDAATLETYFRKNAAKFAESPKVSFSHIYFSADNGHSELARERAVETLHSMESKPVRLRAPELGDHFMLLYDYDNIGKTEAQGLFGDSPFTDSLFTVKENTWSGPFLSGYGWHLLYVNRKQDKTIPPLAEIRNKVIATYKSDKLEQMDNDAMEKLIAKYQVELRVD